MKALEMRSVDWAYSMEQTRYRSEEWIEDITNIYLTKDTNQTNSWVFQFGFWSSFKTFHSVALWPILNLNVNEKVSINCTNTNEYVNWNPTMIYNFFMITTEAEGLGDALSWMGKQHGPNKVPFRQVNYIYRSDLPQEQQQPNKRLSVPCWYCYLSFTSV